MNGNWMIDVLIDLQIFAEKNGLSATATELERVKRLAETEIAIVDGPASEVMTTHARGYLRDLH